MTPSSTPTRSHTVRRRAACAAALANVEEDNWEWHTFDTVKGGELPGRPGRRRDQAKEAIDAVLDLERKGLPFNRTPRARSTSGASRPHAQPRRGRGPPLLLRRRPHRSHDPADALPELRQAGRGFFNEFYVLDLIVDHDLSAGHVPDGEEVNATGVVAYDLATGEIHIFQAKAIIFATGGAGKIYKTTSNAHTLTVTAWPSRCAAGSPSRTWSSSSSTRQVWPAGHPPLGGSPRRGRDPAQR